MARVDVTKLNLLKEALDPVDDLQPSAVTERENERESVVVCGLLDRFVQLRLAGLRQIRQPTDRLEPNIFSTSSGVFSLQKTLEQVHQCKNFALRALPVFRRKGIEGEELDPQIAAAFDAGAHRVGAFLVAFDPGQSALFAQRPLPSIMMATCRGTALSEGFMPARSSASGPAPGPR